MLYIEYSNLNNNATVSMQVAKDSGDCSLNVKPNLIQICTGSGTYCINPVGLSLSCVTCSGLQAITDTALTCNFSASFTGLSASPDIKEHLQQSFANAEALICKLCHSKIVNAKVLENVSFKPAVYSFEDNHISAERFFCHSKNTDFSPSPIELSSAVDMNADCSQGNCIVTGLELAVPAAAIISDTCVTLSNRFVHCARCLSCFGRIIQIGHSDHTVLWTNCVTVLFKESDIDGDFLRYIERPLLDETSFYSLLVESLLENQCYRVILSAVTANGCLDFMLLWLFDQEICVYATALQNCPNATERTSLDRRPETPSKKDSPTKEEDSSLKVEPLLCRRVFYTLVLPTDDNKLRPDTSTLLTAWHQDFGVALIHLPWETCLGIANCLSQLTNRIAPHLRKPDQGSLSGLTCGAIPVLHFDARS